MNFNVADVLMFSLFLLLLLLLLLYYTAYTLPYTLLSSGYENTVTIFSGFIIYKEWIN